MYRKGYLSSRGNLVCRYCGNRYKLEAMESGLASCVPVKLPMQVSGHTVKIKPEDLERERGLF
ncbi:MAG: Fe-S-containing protein, partial [Candidatus Acidiferrales bacterium]